MTRARVAGRAAGLALAAVSLGCASQVGLGRATTLAPGGTRIGIAVEGSLISPKLTPEDHIPLPWIQAVGGVHRGVTDTIELGARVWGLHVPNVLTTIGGAVDGKVQILRAPEGKRGPDVATGLSLTYHQPRLGNEPFHVFGAAVPVLAGWNFGKHQLIVGPRVADFILTSYGQDTINSFYFGASAGFALRLRETFDLFPELVGMYSLTSFGGEGSADPRVGVALLQLAVGGAWELGPRR